MPTRPIWHAAAALAARAHHGQWRRDGKTPYAAHPSRVAMTLASRFGVRDEEVLAAAYLHDVIEDGTVDYDDVEEAFGRNVATLVAVLTKDKRLVEAERERAYDEQLAAGPWQGRLIKLADVFDNFLDAEDDAARRVLVPRVDRILTLAGDDTRLADAAGQLRELVETMVPG